MAEPYRPPPRKSYTPKQRDEIWEGTGGICLAEGCGLPVDRDSDWVAAHNKSRWAGGGDDLSNLYPAHRPCNDAQEAQERPGREKADRAGGGRGSQHGRRQRRQEREAAGLARPMWGKGQRIPKPARPWSKGRKLPSRPMRR